MTTTEHVYHAETRVGRTVEVTGEERIEAAASVAAHKFYPRNRNLTVMRTTGTPGLSGWFQAYVPIGLDGGLTSYGASFHVGS